MSDRQPYSRVYWSVLDDPKFDAIRGRMELLGAWTLLLIVADRSYPAPAYVPTPVARRQLAALVGAGLVDLQGDGRYRIHGLDAERARRAASATRPGPNWVPTGDQLGPEGVHRQRQSTRTSTSTPLPPADDDGRPDLEAFLLVRRRAPTTAQRALMDRYIEVFDLTGPERAERLILANPDDPIGALKDDLDEFRRQRTEEARASEVPKPKPRRSPGLPESARDLLAHWTATREEAQ